MERDSKPPWGNKKNDPVKNIQEYPKPGTTIFYAKRGNALINNQNLNTLRGERDFKFKGEIKVLNYWHGGMRYLRLNHVNSSKRDHFSSDPTKLIDRRLFIALKYLKNFASHPWIN